MAALTQDRATPRLAEGNVFSRDVAADAVIFAGAIVCLSATGWAVPGSTATTLVADGVAQEPVDNTGGANGDVKVRVFKGVFRFGNSAAADAITRAEIGDDCYIVDDQTVAKTSGTNTRSIAGKIVDVDAQGVWVRFV
ncbi:hypothetical protein [Blastomonas fulva]|uniref:hypothetical protein n=1 Tax=Blastomonas fulva TaxID=1550728 RepID=UPI0025A36A3D|nr:hypothetical protein [Blastomonas fulva]MDM7928670.1 hypothetical protein [Blastomonas fulva]MDM7964456.1 hypothetical protein [Blastomonas fulva]